MATQFDTNETFDTSDIITQAPPSRTRYAAIVDSERQLAQAKGGNADVARFAAGLVDVELEVALMF